jgi:hypothetical protein
LSGEFRRKIGGKIYPQITRIRRIAEGREDVHRKGAKDAKRREEIHRLRGLKGFRGFFWKSI